MKEKTTYRRFDLPAFLAILGCAGMLIFECIFIFELYDRTPSQVASLLPAQPARREPGEPAPAAIQTNAPAPVAPNALQLSAPVPPAGNEKIPAAAPVG